MGGFVADEFDLSVVLKIAAQGGAQTTQEVVTLQGAVDKLARSGDLTEKQTAKLTSSLGKQTTAMNNADGAVKKGTESLNSQRYALYEVAAAYGAVSAGLIGLGASAISAFSEMESGFTKVERTSGLYGAAFAPLQEDLLSLGRAIPTVTSEIQDLAARGAQMGIATSEIEGFTETMAKFVATSPEVDINSVAEAFGRISNLTGTKDFEAIASAIAQVGVNSAATDAQIIKTTQEISRAAGATAFTADELVGLAGAFASLGVAPEAARGIMNQFIQSMNRGAAGVTDSMAQAAAQMGVTEEAAKNLWATDPSVFFSNLIAGLSTADNLTVALDDMGLAGQRLSPLFAALTKDYASNAQGASVLSNALADANQGFREKTELDRQYAPIADDLASKQIILANSIKELAFTYVSALAPALKGIVDIITGVVQGFTDLISTPAGRFFATATAATLALITAYTTLRTVVALAAAAQMAFNTAAGSGMARGLVGQLGMLVTGFRGVQTGAHAATASMSGFKVALASTGIGLAVVLLGSLAAAFMQTGASAEDTFNKYITSTSGLTDAIAADLDSFNTAKTDGVANLGDAYTQITPQVQAMTEAVDINREAVYNVADILGTARPAFEDAAAGVDTLSVALGENALAWITNSLTASEEFQKLANEAGFADSWAAIGADFETAVRISAVGGEAAVLDYFYGLANATENGGGAIMSGVSAWFTQIGQSFAVFGQYLGTLVNNIGAIFGDSTAQGNLVNAAKKNKTALDKVWSQNPLTKPFRELSTLLSGTTDQFGVLGREAANAGKGFSGAEEGAGGLSSGLDGLGGSAKNAAEELRTVIDYANDLQSVMSRAIELEFGNLQAGDKITKTFNDLRNKAAEAEQKIKDIRTSIRGLMADIGILQSDIGTQEYFLSIALEYGDTKRAAEIQANLAKIQADLAAKQNDLTKAQDDLTKAQDANSKTLVGNSDQAIANRETVIGLVESYQAQLVALAKSGASQEELRKKSEQLRQDFIRQAVQLGFNREELYKYETSFVNLTAVIAQVPRNVSTNMEITGLSAAEAALREFAAKSATIGAQAGGNFKNGFGGAANQVVPGPQIVTPPPTPWKSWDAVRRYFSENIMSKLATNSGRSLWDQLVKSGYSGGGYTGPGGKHQPAGIVHKGEYVIPKRDVNQSTGLPRADALGKLTRGSQPSGGYAGGGFVQGGGLSGPVDLSAGSIQQLARVLQTQISVDGKIIGEAASRSYAADNRVGAN